MPIIALAVVCMPLALVTGGTLYFIHPDHLNTPQKATDGRQKLAWDAVLRPFGGVANASNRTVTVSNIGWQWGFLKKRYAV